MARQINEYMYIGDKIIPLPLDRRFFTGVMGGTKTSTIRIPTEVREVDNRSHVRFYARQRESLTCVVRVRAVKSARVGQLGDAEVATDGVSTIRELRTTLESHYPGISDDEVVTIIEFDPPISGDIQITYGGLRADAVDRAAADAVADIGWGSWTDDFKGVWDLLGIKREELDRRVGAHYTVTDVQQNAGRLQVTIPATNIDWSYNSIAALLSTAAGSLLGSSYFKGAHVESVELPASVEAQFAGPRLGIEGVRKLCRVPERPLLAFTVKPRLGLDSAEFAKVCVEVAKGGVDIVEDDERLSNQARSDLPSRAKATLAALADARVNAVYSANITGRTDQIVEVADELIDLGVRMLKIDVLPAGFAALQAVSEHLHRKGIETGITVFPAMNAVYDRVGRGLILQLSRLCGADVIYAGIPPFGETPPRVQDEVKFNTAASHHRILREAKAFQRTVLPTVSTAISPMNVGAYTQLLGKNVGFFVGAGIAANPLGLQQGARVMVQALERANEDDPKKIFKDEELVAFGKLFGNFVRYADQPEGVRKAANMVRGL